MGVQNTCCLLCNQRSSSALIEKGNGKSEELSQLFELFCDYLKLDPDRRIRNAYPGKLFPFCNACSFNVYQLFDYHKEKVRILEKLSQVVVSMAVLILESDESDREQESFHNVGDDPTAETLAGQITALRQSVVQNYSPKVSLKAFQPSAIKAVAVEDYDLTENIKNPLNLGINKVSAVVSSENILRSSLQRRTKGSKGKLFVKIKNISDSDADFGTQGAQDDSMDMDYGNDGDANDLNASKSEESDDSKREYSGDEGNVPVQTKGGVTTKRSKRRSRMYPVQIDERAYSFGNYKYTVNGSEFKCETCPNTASSFEKIRQHLRSMHILNVPSIPEKPMDEYKSGKNEYILADKHSFQKVGEKEFRCSTCKHSATTWSKMYTHIRELHFRPTSRRAQVAPLIRPKGVVVPLGENEFEYFGFKYSVLPHGGHTCLTCGALTFTLYTMHGHIRRSHADFLPEVPDKSMEDYEIHPNLFCLSNRYMFERTGDNCFDCTFSDCDVVTPTWKEMYIHIRTDHYFPLERSQKRQREARRVARGKSTASSVASDPQQKVVTKERAGGSVDEPASNPAFDQEQDAVRTNTCDPTRNVTRDESLPPADGNIPGTKGEAPLPQMQSAVRRVRRLCGRKGINVPSQPDPLKEAQDLADLEISPGHYSYQNFDFHFRDEKFMCDSCDASFQLKKLILRHITRVHIANNGFRKTGPNEYLYQEKYPGFRDDQTGKFHCGVQGCDSSNTYPALFNLRLHIVAFHVKGPPIRKRPVPTVEEKREKLKNDMEELRRKLYKFQVGPYQFSYREVAFEFRDDDDGGKYHCGACGSEMRLSILDHISKNHVTNRSQNSRLPENEKFSFEEVSPDEFLVGGQFRVFRLPEGKLKCGVEGCESVSGNKNNMRTHMLLVHKARPEICELCGKVFKNIRILEKHRAVQHEEGEEQKCPQCPKVFRNPAALKQHIRNHWLTATSQPIHQCHTCGKAYTSKSILNNHIRVQHVEVRGTFPCDQCPRVYRTPISLTKHKIVEHLDGGKKTHPCPVCQKQFKYKETVRRHIMVVHEGKKSSEVYKRIKKPGSSTAGTSTGRRGRKQRRTGAQRGSSSESDADTAEENETDEFQKLLGF